MTVFNNLSSFLTMWFLLLVCCQYFTVCVHTLAFLPYLHQSVWIIHSYPFNPTQIERVCLAFHLFNPQAQQDPTFVTLQVSAIGSTWRPHRSYTSLHLRDPTAAPPWLDDPRPFSLKILEGLAIKMPKQKPSFLQLHLICSKRLVDHPTKIQP